MADSGAEILFKSNLSTSINTWSHRYLKYKYEILLFYEFFVKKDKILVLEKYFKYWVQNNLSQNLPQMI